MATQTPDDSVEPGPASPQPPLFRENERSYRSPDAVPTLRDDQEAGEEQQIEARYEPVRSIAWRTQLRLTMPQSSLVFSPPGYGTQLVHPPPKAVSRSDVRHDAFNSDDHPLPTYDLERGWNCRVHRALVLQANRNGKQRRLRLCAVILFLMIAVMGIVFGLVESTASN